MKKIAVGIISDCKSFRLALHTVFTCENEGQIDRIWDCTSDQLDSKQKNHVSDAQLLVVDLDNVRLSMVNFLQALRRKFKRAKVIFLLGERKFDSRFITEYHIDKILKRSSSEIELITAVRSCMA